MISYAILKACSQDNSTLVRLIDASNQLRRTYNRMPNPASVEGWQLKQRIEQLSHVIDQARSGASCLLIPDVHFADRAITG